ncbi:MAG: hypothetical protein ACLRMZ_21585 [Blautia marasmi]
MANDANTFEVDGTTYTIEKAGRENQITISGELHLQPRKYSAQQRMMQRWDLISSTA